MPAVQFQTLGTLDLHGADGRELHSLLAQPKRIALLAYLCVARPSGFHRRDTLVGLFWPDSNQEHARSSLRNALHVLRRVLGDQAILSRGDEEIAVDRHRMVCDAVRFEETLAANQFEASLDLYRGDFLTGFFIDAAPDFDHWLQSQRARLRGEAARAAERAGRALELKGDIRGALDFARRSLELANNDERALRKLLELQDRVGDRAGALASYSSFAGLLAAEYQTTPSVETQRMIERIRSTSASDSAISAGRRIVGRDEPARSSDRLRSVPEPFDARQAPPRRWTSRKAFFALLVPVLLLAAGAGSMLATRTSSDSAPRIHSLAVLPLDNISGDTAQEYFVDGMYNALIAELAQLSALRVIPRGPASRYSPSTTPIAEVARQLRVDEVLRGGVVRLGDSVRIQLELVRAAPERVLWAHTYTRQLRDMPALYDDVARIIANEIEVRLTPRDQEQISNAHRVDPAAYDAWLAGSYHASRRSGADLDACFRYANLATAADPNYAPAHGLLSECYNLATFVSRSPSRAMFEESKRASRRALALDDKLAAAHADLAYALAHYDWDWQAAEKSYRRALQLDPNFVRAEEDLAWLLSWSGHFEEALAHAQRAKELDPYAPQAWLRVAQILFFARRYDDAISESRHAIELDSNYMFGYDRLHWAYLGKEDYPRALEAAKHAAMLSGPADPRRQAFLAHAYAMNGDRVKARAILNRLLEFEPDAYVPPISIALVYIGLGDRNEAIRWVERGYDNRDGDMVTLKVQPMFEPLRGDARYKAIITKMHFPP